MRKPKPCFPLPHNALASTNPKKKRVLLLIYIDNLPKSSLPWLSPLISSILPPSTNSSNTSSSVLCSHQTPILWMSSVPAASLSQPYSRTRKPLWFVHHARVYCANPQVVRQGWQRAAPSVERTRSLCPCLNYSIHTATRILHSPTHSHHPQISLSYCISSLVTLARLLLHGFDTSSPLVWENSAPL